LAYTATHDKTAEHALQRWDDQEQEQRQWLNLWQEIADFCQPRKGNIAFRRSSAQQQTDRLYDSTAPHANELLAASMQGAMTSSAFRWFGLRIKGIEINRDSQLSKDLEWCSNDMYDAYNASNFASESHEVYLDAPCFGTAAMSVEEATPSRNVGPGALLFTAFAPGSYAIDEDDQGYVDTFSRKFRLSARAAAATFGDKIGAQVKAALKQNSNERFEFLQCVYPRTDLPLNLGRALPATKLPFASITVDVAGRCTVKETGYHEQAIMVPRWTKTAGEIYGRGPGTIALPFIKTLNKAVELKLKAWAKVVDPPMMVRDEGVVGTVQFRSAGITYVRDMEAIKALTELGGNLNIADMEEDKLRAEIKRMFYADQLQMQEGPQMTAYEVQVRYELMQRVLGPTLGRMNVELLNPCTNRVFWIRLRASAKDSPYRRIQAWCAKNNVVLDVEYEGPLAKAQRLAESTAMQRYFQIILPLTESNPQIMDNVDLDYVARAHAESVGTPAAMLRTVEDVKAIREGRAAKEKQMEDQAKAESMGKTASGVAPLVKAMSGREEGTIPQGSPVLASG
jgi:hypothetical protein